MTTSSDLAFPETPESLRDKSLLVLDFPSASVIPENLRTTLDAYKTSAVNTPPRVGLDTLRTSAARQFSDLDLVETLGRLPGSVHVIDLRQEPHGFINGMPVSWYSPQNQAYAHLSPETIQYLEVLWLSQIGSQDSVELHSIIDKIDGQITRTATQNHKILRVETEKNLVERLGLQYHRLFVTDHVHPDSHCIDQYLELLAGLPEESWLHFHCRSGLGRTSTFMVLHDIIHNSGVAKLEDIIERQALLGSKNMFQISQAPDKMWRHGLGESRREFIKDFYSYMNHPNGHGRVSWTEWSAVRA